MGKNQASFTERVGLDWGMETVEQEGWLIARGITRHQSVPSVFM